MPSTTSSKRRASAADEATRLACVTPFSRKGWLELDRRFSATIDKAVSDLVHLFRQAQGDSALRNAIESVLGPVVTGTHALCVVRNVCAFEHLAEHAGSIALANAMTSTGNDLAAQLSVEIKVLTTCLFGPDWDK